MASSNNTINDGLEDKDMATATIGQTIKVFKADAQGEIKDKTKTGILKPLEEELYTIHGLTNTLEFSSHMVKVTVTRCVRIRDGLYLNLRHSQC